MVDEADDEIMKLNRAWYKAKSDLDQARKHEMDLRKEVIARNFGDIKFSGTSTEKLGHNAQLVLTVPAKVNIDIDKFESMRGYLEAKGLIGNDKLFKLKPSISLTALKNLDDSTRITIEDMLEHKLGSPSLEVKLIKD